MSVSREWVSSACTQTSPHGTDCLAAHCQSDQYVLPANMRVGDIIANASARRIQRLYLVLGCKTNLNLNLNSSAADQCGKAGWAEAPCAMVQSDCD
jgi:hypothetical protein